MNILLHLKYAANRYILFMARQHKSIFLCLHGFEYETRLFLLQILLFLCLEEFCLEHEITTHILDFCFISPLFYLILSLLSES